MYSDGVLAENRLTTRRLTLSPLTPIHAPALFALLNDWDVVRMLAEVGVYDLHCRSRGALVSTADMHLGRAGWEGARR